MSSSNEYNNPEFGPEKNSPNGNDNNALPVLNLSSIEKRWNTIYEAINSCGNLSQRDIDTLNASERLSYNNEDLNLYVTEIKDTRDDSYCYFVSKYQNTQALMLFFMQKKVLNTLSFITLFILFGITIYCIFISVKLHL